MLLKGSKSKQVEQWMQELTGPDGAKLHGAGSNRSEDWWKGLGNVLLGHGLLASKSKSVRRGSSWGCRTEHKKKNRAQRAEPSTQLRSQAGLQSWAG